MNDPKPGFLLDQNGDWDRFVNLISDNTGSKYERLWIEHARQNRKRVKTEGWAASDLLDAGVGKTAVIIGAAPSVRSKVSDLRFLQRDSGFLLYSVSSGLGFLLDNGIIPDYCMVMDADPTIARFFETVDERAKDVTLIASVCTDPKIVEKWPGPVKWIAVYSSIKALDRKYRKWYSPVNGCGIMFPALCSQYNTAVAAAYRISGSRILIFVGNDLSFPDGKDSRYYADRNDIKDGWLRMPHPDIYGNKVYTTYNFMTLKLACEDYLQRMYVESVSMEGRAPYFFNATESGIFGVSKRHGNLSVTTPAGEKLTVMWQIPLHMAIRQARNIMLTGRPITENAVLRPSMSDIYAVHSARI
jgi:hypothetical protein